MNPEQCNAIKGVERDFRAAVYFADAVAGTVGFSSAVDSFVDDNSGSFEFYRDEEGVTLLRQKTTE